MDIGKKASFVKARRQKLSKGGVIRRLGNRKYFADGGTTLGGPTDTGTKDSSTQPNQGFLGNINGSLGLNNNFNAASADIQNGTNANQLNQSYQGVNNALDEQGNIVNTLRPQVQGAVTNQNNLATQLYGMTQGTGPNPAKAQLAEATAANVAQTGAQMAGARGANQNVGLMARQIGAQGAETQQKAVGQAATMQAEQQIAAQNNLANLSNNQISQTGQAVTGQNSVQQNEQSILQNANTSANNARVAMQSNMNNNNAQTSAANQNMAANTFGGITSAASGLSSMFAKGGKVDHLKIAEMNVHAIKHANKYDEGGEVDSPNMGSFKSSDDSASSPNVAASAPLPADQTDFSKSVQGGGSKGGGGGGGMGSMVGMLAALADGGPVEPIGQNPLLNSQSKINGPGTFGANFASASGASAGPNVGGGASFATNGANLSNAGAKAGKAIRNFKNSPDSATNQSDEQTQQSYLDADVSFDQHPDQIGPQTKSQAQAGTDEELPAINEDVTTAAKGGMMRAPGPHKSHVANYLYAEGGKVPAMVSPGEIYLSPDKVHKVIHEGVDPAKIGHKFGGKAKVKGDSLKNDIIPEDLEEGGVVIDRKNMGTREKRELFVHRAIARKKAGR